MQLLLLASPILPLPEKHSQVDCNKIKNCDDETITTTRLSESFISNSPKFSLCPSKKEKRSRLSSTTVVRNSSSSSPRSSISSGSTSNGNTSFLKRLSLRKSSSGSLSSSSNKPTTRKKRCSIKKVQFDDEATVVHTVESYIDEDIWWSDTDLAIFRTQMKRLCNTNEVITYFHFVEMSYYHTNTNQPMQGMINGYNIGYQGLERMSIFEKRKRIQCKQYIRTIVKAYESTINNDQCCQRTNNDSILLISKLAIQLTESSRKWAHSKGIAAHLACNND